MQILIEKKEEEKLSTSCRGCCRAVATLREAVIRARSPCRYDRQIPFNFFALQKKTEKY